MPNSLTSTDIEDVLGAIRRLVSEEAAAKARKSGETERLVLTPDCRVAPDEPLKSGPLKPGHPVGPVRFRHRLAAELDDLEESVRRKAAQWREDEPEHAPEARAGAGIDPAAALAAVTAAAELAAREMTPAEMAEVALPDAAEAEAEAEAGFLDVDASAPDADQVQADALAEPPAEPLSAAVLRFPRGFAARADEYEDEVAAVLAPVAVEVVAQAADQPSADAAQEAEDVGFAAGAGLDFGADDFMVAPETAEPAGTAADRAVAAELEVEDDLAPEAGLAGASGFSGAWISADILAGVEAYDEWEPAGEQGRPVFRGPGSGGTDEAPEEPVIEAELIRLEPTLVAEPPQPPLPDNVAQADSETLLDEAELRALVAEVLREELKGPLGERITRNVRKLVRREIAQALSSMEID